MITEFPVERPLKCRLSICESHDIEMITQFISIIILMNTGPHRVLLMTHGWPGSVWEFYKILPLLTQPEKHGGRESDAFEVICPSIPGYGFSESPHQTGI